ncbi:MAG: exosortase family protein XrtG [Inconstantimicrobium porci]|uniref:Exosortase family protein XrtG n=1 Tax=Inconstantimicrobium porci TaxID=2652291 RepID=A0A7X2N044_9CLOT|nr:exosortase family protein XrtG [Inconstantimicrobium porci]MDD6771155.1 exosortase family protein XrtG [Inconstantimicrobium porci]MDY5911820.1 exosortase family protein XrtG [Inconstantimicrobium porci]MSR92316.1 exosortase family protein XrtG [Inconstantimicrobium porci]
MKIFLFVMIIIWIYFLYVFHRANLKFFEFLFGSIGLFVVLMIFVRPYLTVPLAKLICAAEGVIGDITGMFKDYYDYGLLFINNKHGAISLYIDYECSGVIEIMTLSSMLWFFPSYRLIEKTIINLAAVLFIFLANLIRITLICTIVFCFGPRYFYIAHTVIGRLVFYALSIMMYFYIFTRTQVIRQKIGVFKYENNN